MFSALFQPCELKLHLLQNAVFLHPPDRPLPETHERPPQANDELVRGLVELYVPSNRHISGIRVRLKAVQTIAILDSSAGITPINWEDTTVLERVVEIGIHSDSRSAISSPQPRSVSLGPGAHSATSSSSAYQERGRSAAPPGSRNARGSSAFPIRSSSPGGSIPASMARAVSRGRRLASTVGRISHSPSPSNSRQASRATSPTDYERGRPDASLPPPSYDQAIHSPYDSNGPSMPPTPGTDSGQELADCSAPPSAVPSQLPTPQLSRRPSFSNSTSPQQERDRPSFSSPENELAAHLQRTLGVHAESNNAKGKGRSSSVGWAQDIGFFGSRSKGARSKSRANSSRGHSTDLANVDEDHHRGRRGVSKIRAHSSIPEGGDPESGWETEHREDGLELQKGIHGFEFAFIIPCDAPPYERSPYGRVRYIIKATAIGAGRAKSNVECWRDLYPMVNPAPDGGATPLTVLYNDLHPTVGLVSIACTSNNISVGGVFNIDIHSPTPAPDLIVYLVRVSLETTIELHTKKRGKQTVPVQRHKMFEKGWVPPKNPDGGHGDGKKSDGFIRSQGNDHAWTVQGIARIPDDNTIRASTVGGSKASVRFSHVLVVEIVHSRQSPDSKATTPEEDTKERRLKVFALRQPVLIPSCCCAYDAVTLPAYSADPDPDSRRADMPWDIGQMGHHGNASHNNSSNHQSGANAPAAGPSRLNSTNTGTPVNGPSHMFCVCGMSLQDLSEQERALIPTRPIEVLDGAHFRHQGKIGELPTERSPSEGGSGTRRRSPSMSSNAGGSSGAGVVASLRGRRGSTSSTRTTIMSGSGTSERRPSITAGIAGRSPSVASALRARRGSEDAEGGAPRFVGGNAMTRGTSASRGSIGKVSLASAGSAGASASAATQGNATEEGIPEEQ